jgi:hypothetical protein
VLDLTASQAGCAAVCQLIALPDVSEWQALRWRHRGLLEPMHRGVVRIAGSPDTEDQRLWGALLRCGEGAVAGPAATCWLFGLEGYERLCVDVALPAPRRCRETGFPALTRTLEPMDTVVVRGFAALSPTRAIIELAATLSPKQLRVLIDSARRRRLLDLDRLRRRAQALLREPGTRRGAKAVLRALGTGTLQQESENERELLAFLASTSLRLEWQVSDLVPGRRFDAVDREAELILEVDSRLWHSLGSDRDADHLRDLEVGDVIGTYRVVRVTLGMVRYHAEETRQRLDAIRAARVRDGRR